MASIVLRQTVIMLLLMLCGVLCFRIKLISAAANRELSRFVLEVVNPAMIFMSYQTDYRPELVRELLLCFGLSVVVFGFMIAAAYLLLPAREGRQSEVERFSGIYSNCGFMGIPLVSAMFGSEGVFCLTAFITVFNLFAWTHGVILISGEKSAKNVGKVFRSPTMIAIYLGLICFFVKPLLPDSFISLAARTKVPDAVGSALEYLASLNTPLAMIVSGVTMAQTDLRAMVKKAGVYRVCAVRLLAIPAVLAVGAALLPFDKTVTCTVLAAASAPPAAMCTLQCLRCGKDPLYASEIFTAGTILSVLSLPFIISLTEFLTKIVA